MTTAALSPSKTYIEDGVTLNFPVPFRYLAPSDLAVDRIAANGTKTRLALGTGYTATSGPTDAGGTLTLLSTVAGATLRIRRATARNQSTDYATADTFPAESHEAALDRSMLIDQEQDVAMADLAARALLLPDGESTTTVPSQAQRANGYLAFDLNGNPIIRPLSSTVEQVATIDTGAVINAKAMGVAASAIIDNSATLRAALIAAATLGLTLQLPAGLIYCPTWNAPTLSGAVRIVGAGRQLTLIKGTDLSKSFLFLNPGGSFSARACGWDTWESACRLVNNTGLAAFELLEASDCFWNAIARSPITDYDTYNATGGIKEVRFIGNLVTNASAATVAGFNWAGGFRLDCYYITSAWVCDNEIRSVGSNAANGQRSGIFLGGATFVATGTYTIKGNRIYDVENSATSPGGGTGHCSGITAFGRSVRIEDNYINGVTAWNAANTDCYGIYVKASWSRIVGNHCVDAGGNQSTIMCKGAPNVPVAEAPFNAFDVEKIIAHNTIVRETVQVNDPQTVGITCYNSGHNVHDNNIGGVHTGIVIIAPLSTAAGGTKVDRQVIHHNNIHDLKGTAGYTQCNGIVLNSPNDVLVESNVLKNIGAGTETLSYGISVLFATFAGNHAGLTIRGNRINTVTAATTSAARGINLVFDATGGTSANDIEVTNNSVANIGRGINVATAGTINGLTIEGNNVTNASVAAYGNSGGLTTWNGSMRGNKLAGVPWVTPSSLNATPAVFGLNRVRTANAAATTITNFTGGIDGQELLVEVDANTTIANNANIRLVGGANWAPGANGGTIQFVRNGTAWREVSRAAY